MSPLFAFLHHLAAFALVACLTLEFVLVRGGLTLERARALRVADMVYGASAGIVLLVGFLRVFYFEKGAAYYFHSIPFIAKLSLFVLVGLLSIYPTIEFQAWKQPLTQGRIPAASRSKLQTMRTVMHLELAGVALIILCAVLMAKGIGYVG